MKLKEAGVPDSQIQLETSQKFLTGEEDVLGYASWGSNDRSNPSRVLGNAWLDGAIVSEYVSTNARTFEQPPANWKTGKWSDPPGTFFAGSPQGLIADYIHEGVTGISGNVYEPYLQACARPQILFPAYFRGHNLAELLRRAAVLELADDRDRRSARGHLDRPRARCRGAQATARRGQRPPEIFRGPARCCQGTLEERTQVTRILSHSAWYKKPRSGHVVKHAISKPGGSPLRNCEGASPILLAQQVVVAGADDFGASAFDGADDLRSDVPQRACQGRSITRPAGRSKNRPLLTVEEFGSSGSAEGAGAEACAAVRRRRLGRSGRRPCRSRHPAGWDRSGTTFGWQAFGVAFACFPLGGNFPRSSPRCGRDG